MTLVEVVQSWLLDHGPFVLAAIVVPYFTARWVRVVFSPHRLRDGEDF